MSKDTFSFLEAKPIWQRDHAYTMNRTIDFCCTVLGTQKNAVLYTAASCSYVITVNGHMIAHGPQRTAHGFYCVDEIVLAPWLCRDVNTVAVRVAGYNCNSYAHLDQPSFFCGELRDGDTVLAYTSDASVGFSAYEVTERVQKVTRFSFQRTFSEVYDLSCGTFEAECGTGGVPCEVSETEPKIFLKRSVPYGDYEKLTGRVFQGGTVTQGDKQEAYKNRYFDIKSDFKGFAMTDGAYSPIHEYERLVFSEPTPAQHHAEIHLTDGQYADVDFERDYAGVFEFDVSGTCDELLFAFDEVLQDGHVNPIRFSTAAVIVWKNLNGSAHLITAEPYTLRYLRVIARGGSVTIRNLQMNKIAFPSSRIRVRYNGNDAVMRQIFDAAVETFCANTVDIYMDCPSRERAGWLCDSFFTGRVEKVLTGDSKVERAFLKNFLLPDAFRCLPRGMLPMCYPSDFYNHDFIPNWAMWYVLELCEYFARTGDRALIDMAKPKMDALDRYLRRFENEHGLLEKLEKWVFVEWSKANELVQDVSFASNMLYVGYKRAMAQLYNDTQQKAEADRLTETIRTMARCENGFFCDNAVRVNGQLVLSGECTEACQYYAFFFDVATPQRDAKLWQILLHDFGPARVQKGLYPQIYPANAFIGNYLRLDILCRYGCTEQLYENIRGYFAYMAERTGTLWENTTPHASCNHGFASHVLYWMDKLGLLQYDA